ncbi:hypothetical protein OG982_30725 [Streptomyces sp. NBC_01551]|uniref:hypothetical protein n=1 Tax=Streptomyces sp. NBC_01551 TaxID=2975876 RepID=UPI00224DBD8A|nr:hypothetical protein [Streptomyces sp. NBC_01551]MCX4529997.1 hypothetical protein [Streptomyces sp. NBC_01551]
MDEVKALPENYRPEVTEPVLDMYLGLLVPLLELDERNHIPVTLTVSGAVIYGELISYDVWKSEWVKLLQESTQGAGVDVLAKFPQSVDDVRQELVDAGELHVLKSPPRFVHLRDVSILGGSHSTTINHRLWRGRLAEVSGWSLGTPSW